MIENSLKTKIRFIDCGGNIGQTTEWALSRLKNYDVHVDCFEPLPLNLEKIREKHGSNVRVTIHNYAVSTIDGETDFYCQNHGARTGSSLVKGKEGLSEFDRIQVKTINLANWLNNIKREDEELILKLDIEGAEYSVIPHLLENNVHHFIKIWLVEFHGKKVGASKEDRLMESNLKDKVSHLIDWSKFDVAEKAFNALFPV
jgi:FkbM family methyltransferase